MFVAQLAGATYMDVHRAGGGIHFTVEHTRAAGAWELLSSLTSRLERMLRAGTTLVECKSGYGLELQTEVKMLDVIEQARRTLPINISSTYCGAHAVPKYGAQSRPITSSHTAFNSRHTGFLFQREDGCRGHRGHPASAAAAAEGTHVRRNPQSGQHRRLL